MAISKPTLKRRLAIRKKQTKRIKSLIRRKARGENGTDTRSESL